MSHVIEEADVRDSLDVGVLGYHTGRRGRVIVESALKRPLADAPLVSICDLLNHFAEVDHGEEVSQDYETDEAIAALGKEEAIWIDSGGYGKAPVCAALQRAHDILKEWIEEHRGSFPPLVIHITSGESEDGDPIADAEALKSLATDDGNVLLLNFYLSIPRTKSLFLPSCDRDLPDAAARTLFEMSSVMPEWMCDAAVSEGHELQPRARAMAVNRDPLRLLGFCLMEARRGLSIPERPEARSDGPAHWPPATASPEEIKELEQAPFDAPAGLAPSLPVVEVVPVLPPTASDEFHRAPPDEPPHPLDEDVQFSVYRPNTVRPQTWALLLAFAHLSERRADAKEDEPDPIEEVVRQARGVLEEEFDEYLGLRQDSRRAVPREGELTFVPKARGVEFDPPSGSFCWKESVHREEFRFRASARMDGKTARGRLTVFLGSVILAEVPLSIRVDSGHVAKASASLTEVAVGRPYRKLFASYSHKDEPIVGEFERYFKSVGDRYLRDWIDLRAGEEWSDRLEQMIEEADVFQLFWSWNSMRSGFVEQEWRYALSLDRPHFVRPVYWEEPMPSDRSEDLPPEDLRRLHFHRLPGGGGPHEPPFLGEDAAAAGKVCSACAARVDRDARFCSACGKPLGLACPQCGKTGHPPEARFCAGCGQGLDAALDSLRELMGLGALETRDVALRDIALATREMSAKEMELNRGMALGHAWRMIPSLESAQSLAKVAQTVVEDPLAWSIVVAEVRMPEFVRRLERDNTLEPVVKSLQDGQTLAEPPLGFVAAALTFEMLGRPDYRMGLHVLDHAVEDLRFLEIRITVGEAIAEAVEREASADDKTFFYIALGNAYAQCPSGSRGENQESAILCYEQALSLCSRAGTPEDRSMLENNLGNAYKERLAGSWRVNHQRARACYEEAMECLDEARDQQRIDEPEYRERQGDVTNNLGNVHRDRPLGPDEPPGGNIELAVECLSRSLELRKDSPLKRAETLRNLGTTLVHHRRSEAESLERALEYFYEALAIYETHPMPLWHAMTLMNLGAAYTARREGSRRENLLRARRYLRDAAQRYEDLKIRRERVSAQLNLGLLEVEAGDLTTALGHFETAAGLVEDEFAESETEMARGAWLQLHADVYEGVIAAAVMLDRKPSEGDDSGATDDRVDYAARAAFWAEISRAKNLAEWMALDCRPPALARLRDVDHRLSAAEKAPLRERSARTLGEEEGQLRRRRRELHEGLREQFRRDSTGSQAMQPRQFQELADATGSALLTLRATPRGTCAVLVPPGGRIRTRLFDTLLPPQLAGALRRWHGTYESSIRAPRSAGFAGAPPGARAQARQAAVGAWREAIGEVLEELGDALGRDLDHWLREWYPRQADCEGPQGLIVLPGQGFSVLPLHAMRWTGDGGRVYTCDEYQMSYVPSCRVLEYCLERKRRRGEGRERFLSVQNPTAGDGREGALPWFDVLGREVSRWFDDRQILGPTAAPPPRRATFQRLTGFVDRERRAKETPGELERHEVVLMATHGCYDPENPWERSGLEIACADPGGGPSRLTLSDLFELNLSRLRLMVLAACETAGTDPADPTGEQLGLPAALLAAGATTAVGSLWEVESGPTMLLIRQFFEELFAHDRSTPSGERSSARALWRAQRWLRECPPGELNRLLQEIAPGAVEIPPRDGEPSFGHPYYWSAFGCYGAP
ncbi:MAG: CHAT domain-containing protein [Planctomycetes bacterium]|nr:CHAT domain-containing protein [Planctomycetota bacterium]